MTTRQAHVFFLCAALLLGHLSAEAAMRTVRVASGLTRPLYAISPPGDYNRLFIVEQGGLIRILKDGVILTQPFLDLTDSVSCCGERGLLGLAFHPDYATNGYFYVNHTRGPFSASET
ncbi:MAG TPA: PQQ-dependent sugar dehydrogenase, partial [candidate division Zixibacteria bacterium]|nr:PQQ-dependent sugar dehydrogenase [candidate division Zixibacteria bacterium]